MLRALSDADLPFLTTMAVAACNEPRTPEHPVPEENPGVRRLVDDWGRPGDVGVLARSPQGDPQGAAWCRLFERPLDRAPDGAPLPELVMAVAAEWRGQGVGGALLDELLRAAGVHGHSALTLKVSHRNRRARELYESRGFTVFRREERGVWMRREL